MTSYWGYTMKPLVELLRMRYCAVRWDFGMRYLDCDLPPAVYDRGARLGLHSGPWGFEAKLATATAWGAELLRELDVP